MGRGCDRPPSPSCPLIVLVCVSGEAGHYDYAPATLRPRNAIAQNTMPSQHYAPGAPCPRSAVHQTAAWNEQ